MAMNQQLYYIWKTILPALENHEYSSPFQKPVDPVALRKLDYHSIIENPICINDIKKKLRTGKYKTANQCKKDFQLMFDNCYKYNPVGIRAQGKSLEAFLKEKFTKLPKNKLKTVKTKTNNKKKKTKKQKNTKKTLKSTKPSPNPPDIRKLEGHDEYALSRNLSSKRLPRSNLSDHLETKVNQLVKSKGKEEEVGKIHVRCLYNKIKHLEVKENMKARFKGAFPEEIQYRARAFFAFQEKNGKEICFFGLHSQEYKDCGSPNNDRVYIGYLDSVKIINGWIRSEVYMELILGYFEYCGRLGYRFGHIWSCPPEKGDDYLFNIKPPSQKVPDQPRLNDWYKTGLEQGENRGSIKGYQEQNDDICSVTEHPYFEGDLWTNVMEKVLDEKTPKRTTKNSGKKQYDVTQNKIVLSKARQYLKDTKKNNFVVILNNDGAQRIDTDPEVDIDLMDTRFPFLKMCQEQDWKFSSPQEATVSTQHMLIELYKKFNVDQEEPKCFSCVHKEHNYSIVPHGQGCICTTQKAKTPKILCVKNRQLKNYEVSNVPNKKPKLSPSVDQEEPKCFSCVHKEHNYSIVPHGQGCICKELLMEDKSEKAEESTSSDTGSNSNDNNLGQEELQLQRIVKKQNDCETLEKSIAAQWQKTAYYKNKEGSVTQHQSKLEVCAAQERKTQKSFYVKNRQLKSYEISKIPNKIPKLTLLKSGCGRFKIKTVQETKNEVSFCNKRQPSKKYEISKVPNEKPKLTSSESGYGNFKFDTAKETENKVPFCDKRQRSKQDDISNVPNKRQKLASSEAAPTNLIEVNEMTKLSLEEQERRKHTYCAIHFMRDLAQLKTNTNSRQNLKPIDNESEYKKTFAKDATKEMLKKFNNLYSSSAHFRENFNTYKLYCFEFPKFLENK